MKSVIKTIILVALAMSYNDQTYAADLSLKNEQIVPLWTRTAPGSQDVVVTEKVTDASTDAKNPQRVIEGVVVPSLTAFIPRKSNGAAVIIFPGGLYSRINFDREGADVARWMNSLGMIAFVIKSRMPADGHVNGKDVPLQDAQRAVRLVRTHSKRWGIDPARIGVMGISSGAHTAAMLGAQYAKRVYTLADDVDEYSARPDWMILVSPQISGNAREYLIREQPPLLPREIQDLYDSYPVDKLVTRDTAKCFIAAGHDDKKDDPENAVRMYNALKRAGVNVEMHIMSKGVIDFSPKSTPSVRNWTGLCVDWLREAGILK